MTAAPTMHFDLLWLIMIIVFHLFRINLLWLSSTDPVQTKWRNLGSCCWTSRRCECKWSPRHCYFPIMAPFYLRHIVTDMGGPGAELRDKSKIEARGGGALHSLPGHRKGCGDQLCCLVCTFNQLQPLARYKRGGETIPSHETRSYRVHKRKASSIF